METTGVAMLENVRDVLVNVLGIEDRADRLTESTALFGGLPELDSMAVVELVVALEQRFGIEISDEDVTGEVFETLGSLTSLVQAKVGSSATR
jgi:acyl carrier protein